MFVFCLLTCNLKKLDTEEPEPEDQGAYVVMDEIK